VRRKESCERERGKIRRVDSKTNKIEPIDSHNTEDEAGRHRVRACTGREGNKLLYDSTRFNKKKTGIVEKTLGGGPPLRRGE